MIDNTDRQILQFLKENSKLTIKEISQKTNLSPTPVYERIKKLEKEGIIQSYTIVIDKKKLDLKMMVFCQISLEVHQKEVIELFEQEIFRFEEVSACYHLAGIMDYLLHIEVKDMNDYQNFLKNKLATIKNIRKVQSSFVLTEVKTNARF